MIARNLLVTLVCATLVGCAHTPFVGMVCESVEASAADAGYLTWNVDGKTVLVPTQRLAMLGLKTPEEGDNKALIEYWLGVEGAAKQFGIPSDKLALKTRPFMFRLAQAGDTALLGAAGTAVVVGAKEVIDAIGGNSGTHYEAGGDILTDNATKTDSAPKN